MHPDFIQCAVNNLVKMVVRAISRTMVHTNTGEGKGDITDIDVWRGCLYGGIMPRTARSIEAGMIYHVLNRGNGRMRLFHKERGYDAFERVLSEGLGRYSVDMLGRRNWTRLVNGGLAPEALRTVRQCLARGRPLGSLPWVRATAARLGLGFTLRDAGRPPKNLNNQ